jgi:hypothetical protein
MAFCAVYALSGAGRILLHGGGAALVAWSMALTLPAARVYSSRPAPAVSAVTDAIEGSTNETVAMHAVMRRTEQWYHDNASGRVLLPVHGREVDALVQQWRTEPARRVMFIADPRRSDLARLDSRSRALTRTYEWGFPELPFVGGTRPGEAHLYSLNPPGWMLGEGWAVTAEVGGQTVRAGAEPHRKPAIAWVRARDGESRLLIGGRNLGQPGSASGRITLSITGSAIASFDAAPGYFFETRTLPGGQLTGADTYLPLQVTVSGPVSLEQFDLQPSAVPMVGYLDGWHEPEYNPALGRSWRWMSQSAALWVPPVGRDVTLTLSAENPLRYFDHSPTLRVSVGDQVLARFTPAADFTREVRIPRELLVTGNARVTIESDRSFVPGRGDARALALRVYSVTVN